MVSFRDFFRSIALSSMLLANAAIAKAENLFVDFNNDRTAQSSEFVRNAVVHGPTIWFEGGYPCNVIDSSYGRFFGFRTRVRGYTPNGNGFNVDPDESYAFIRPVPGKPFRITAETLVTDREGRDWRISLGGAPVQEQRTATIYDGGGNGLAVRTGQTPTVYTPQQPFNPLTNVSNVTNVHVPNFPVPSPDPDKRSPLDEQVREYLAEAREGYADEDYNKALTNLLRVIRLQGENVDSTLIHTLRDWYKKAKAHNHIDTKLESRLQAYLPVQRDLIPVYIIQSRWSEGKVKSVKLFNDKNSYLFESVPSTINVKPGKYKLQVQYTAADSSDPLVDTDGVMFIMPEDKDVKIEVDVCRSGDVEFH